MNFLRNLVAIVLAAGFFCVVSNDANAQSASYAKVQEPWYQQGKISGGIAVTNTSAATALPSNGFTAWICNTGSNDAYLAFGTSNAVTATVTGSSWLKGGTCGNYDLNPLTVKFTYVAALTASSTTTLTVETGLGSGPLLTSAGGGTAAAVTVADGADVTQGSTADAAATAGSTGSISSKLRLMTTQLNTINTTLGAATPAGSNLIGKVGIDQTTPGTTNGVQVNAALPAGTNVIGHVIADSGSTTAATQATAANLNATVVGTGTFATQAAPTPVTSGGLSTYFVQPTASDNHANIKNGAGQVYKLTMTNNSATVNYLRLYDAGTGFNGCNSATNLKYQVAIPASTSVGGLSDSWDMGMAFTTGISICVTAGYATTDTTSATATAMSVNIGYK